MRSIAMQELLDISMRISSKIGTSTHQGLFRGSHTPTNRSKGLSFFWLAGPQAVCEQPQD